MLKGLSQLPSGPFCHTKGGQLIDALVKDSLGRPFSQKGSKKTPLLWIGGLEAVVSQFLFLGSCPQTTPHPRSGHESPDMLAREAPFYCKPFPRCSDRMAVCLFDWV